MGAIKFLVSLGPIGIADYCDDLGILQPVWPRVSQLFWDYLGTVREPRNLVCTLAATLGLFGDYLGTPEDYLGSPKSRLLSRVRLGTISGLFGDYLRRVVDYFRIIWKPSKSRSSSRVAQAPSPLGTSSGLFGDYLTTPEIWPSSTVVQPPSFKEYFETI